MPKQARLKYKELGFIEVKTLNLQTKFITAIMVINKSLLEKLQRLCALKLEATDQDAFLKYLTDTLSHFEKINDIPTQGVAPLTSPFSPTLSLRKDKAVTQEDTEVFLEQAPERLSKLFKVPPVV